MDSDVSIPEDLTIMSFFYGKEYFVLRDQLLINNIPFIDASDGEDIALWQHRVKILLISKAIEKVKTRYVIVLDGTDVLLGRNINSIVDLFKETDSKILYNACVFSHPLSKNIHDFHKETVHGVFDKLNTGAFIGEAEFVKEFYTELMKTYDEVDMPVPHTDGIRVALTMDNYPEVKVDYDCKVFQTLLGVSWEIEGDTLLVRK